MRNSFWWWTFLVSLTGCGNPQALAARCDPAGMPVAPAVSVDDISGDYAIHFIATAGTRSGDTVSAILELRDQDPDLTEMPDGSVQTAVGDMDLPRNRLGVADTGDPLSTSDSAPGVGVYLEGDPASPSVVARVGSHANARGPASFDGAWFTLFFEKADANGIAGSWRSGMSPAFPPVSEARGRFCADRLR